jgi:putative flippase GtrA
MNTDMDLTGVAQQFGFFFVAGVLTTLLDFFIYNLLTRPPVRWPRIRANCVSVTVAICFSFTVNLFFVFQPEGGHVMDRVVRFLIVTTFSAYVLQNLVIFVTSQVWLLPVRTAVWASRYFVLTRSLGDDFVKRNSVKLMAVSVGLVWNFLWYRFFVFS